MIGITKSIVALALVAAVAAQEQRYLRPSNGALEEIPRFKTKKAEASLGAKMRCFSSVIGADTPNPQIHYKCTCCAKSKDGLLCHPKGGAANNMAGGEWLMANAIPKMKCPKCNTKEKIDKTDDCQ